MPFSTISAKVLGSVFAAATGFFITVAPQQASAQEAMIGEILIFGGNFCPRSYAAANGQLLPISQYNALFSILGTIYGGDGRTTFALPDLRGRSIIHAGTGPGLTNRSLGERSGTQTTTLTTSQIPSHNHMVNAANNANGFADRTGAGNDFLGVPSYNAPGSELPDLSIYSDTANVQMDSRMISNTGGGLPVSIQDPYLTMTVCIALTGVYPSRN